MLSPSFDDLVAVCLPDTLTLFRKWHFKPSCPKLSCFFSLSSSPLPLHIFCLLYSKSSSLHWMVGLSAVPAPDLQFVHSWGPASQAFCEHPVQSTPRIWQFPTTAIVNSLVIATIVFLPSYSVTCFSAPSIFTPLAPLLPVSFQHHLPLWPWLLKTSTTSTRASQFTQRNRQNPYHGFWPSLNSVTSSLTNHTNFAVPGPCWHLHYTVIALAVPVSLQVSSLGGLSSFWSFLKCNFLN